MEFLNLLFTLSFGGGWQKKEMISEFHYPILWKFSRPPRWSERSQIWASETSNHSWGAHRSTFSIIRPYFVGWWPENYQYLNVTIFCEWWKCLYFGTKCVSHIRIVHRHDRQNMGVSFLLFFLSFMGRWRRNSRISDFGIRFSGAFPTPPKRCERFQIGADETSNHFRRQRGLKILIIHPWSVGWWHENE